LGTEYALVAKRRAAVQRDRTGGRVASGGGIV